MGVGLNLTGHCPATGDDAETWLGRVQSWLEVHAGEPAGSVCPGLGADENPAVLVNLHPCGEDVEIAVPGAGRVVVSAKTSTVGPGYHAHLCGLLHRLGDAMAIDWDEPDEESGQGDETGYFHTGDQQRLEDEFLTWLRGVVTMVNGRLAQDYQWMMISMPVGHHYRQHGPLVTPVGPRDVQWLEAVAENPSRGTDLFPWWPTGMGAAFYLGRALAVMWRDVRWRVPLTDDEGRLLMDVHLDLARAYRLNPSLDYPWREWNELMEYIEAHFGYVEMAGGGVEAQVRQRVAEVAAEPAELLIGYRRLPVRVDLTDGWSIEIPGEMAEEWDDEGLWTARDALRALFFKSYSLSKDDGSKPAAREILDGLRVPEGRRIEHRSDDLIGRAVITPPSSTDEAAWQLVGHSVINGGLAACNIMFGDPDECDWAIATWKSLGHT